MKILSRLFVLVLLVLAACGDSKGTINIGNPDVGDINSIKIGKLTADGKSAIAISQDVFGGADKIDVSNFSVSINGTPTINNLAASDYFNELSKAVQFVLKGLIDGDILTFSISVNGAITTYEGPVSDSEATEAPLEAGVASAVKGIFMVDEANDTCTTDGNPATDDFGLADSSDRDDLCLELSGSGDFSFMDIDDDHNEVITELSGRTFKIKYQDLITEGADFICSLTYATNGQSISGQCRLVHEGVTHTCNLAYTKVGNDPNASVLVDGLPHGCDNPESFSDLRAIQ